MPTKFQHQRCEEGISACSVRRHKVEKNILESIRYPAVNRVLNQLADTQSEASKSPANNAYDDLNDPGSNQKSSTPHGAVVVVVVVDPARIASSCLFDTLDLVCDRSNEEICRVHVGKRM